MRAGIPRMHPVHVRIYHHQNVKLMLHAAEIQESYKELLKFMVCSICKEICMLGDWPGPEMFRDKNEEVVYLRP